jgi:hypothetical protein
MHFQKDSYTPYSYIEILSVHSGKNLDFNFEWREHIPPKHW